MKTIIMSRYMSRFGLNVCGSHIARILVAASVIAVVAFSSSAFAQQGGNQQAIPSQTSLADSVVQETAVNQVLSRILHSIETIDTARQNELIQWIITDRNIRSRVISALRKGGYRISPNSVAEMTVTEKPPTSSSDMELLRLVVESIGIYGEPNIKRILGSNLYDFIKYRQGYEYTLISTEPARQKIQFVYIDASLFGGDIIFKSGFGFGLRVGNDWVGYPFWLPGTIGTYGIVRNGSTDFMIGLHWPLGEAGMSPYIVSGGGLQVRPRKLMGSMAFSAELKQDLDILPEPSGRLRVGAEFYNAFTPSLSNFPSMANDVSFKTGTTGEDGFRHGAPDSLYYLALSAHAYISYKLPSSSLPGMYVDIGGGMHSIQPTTVGVFRDGETNGGLPNTDLDLAARLNYFDPFIRVGYTHTGETGEDWGASVQYSNTLLADGWVKVFPWLQIEAKYATVVFRDPYNWEWQDYVMISPKLTLNF